VTTSEPIAPPEGMLNFRDVGGLPAGPGRRVRRGVLFRGDSPQFLTARGADLLVGTLGVRTEIDLRRAEEAEREGRGPLAGTDVVHAAFPVTSRRHQPGRHQPGRHQEAPVTDVPVSGDVGDVADHYLGYLEVSGTAVAGAVRRLADPAALPALVHCAAGKDRTGVVVGFALSVAGVTDADVADEYAAGSHAVGAVVERLRALPGYAVMIDNLPPESHLTPPEYLADFLAAVHARWGGPRAWLAGPGQVPEADLDRLAALLTEPA